MNDAMSRATAGPLTGVRVIELAGLGPVPFAATLLAGMGAEVVRIARPGSPESGGLAHPGQVNLDLGNDAGRAEAFDMIRSSDVLLEGFRPGVLERMGLAPPRLHAANPMLVIGRMTAWGQDGPLARVPAHDINVLALSGLLSSIGPAERPAIPLNLIADYGGGALYLALGVVAALFSARATGIGSTVDCAMYDGVVSMMATQLAMMQTGRAVPAREANLLDGGAPFYTVYACARDGFIAVGAIEPQFYAALLDGIGLRGDPEFTDQHDRTAWPRRKERMAAIFRTRTRDDWVATFEGVEACVTPVLDLAEAIRTPHAQMRGAFVRNGELTIPAPAPRFAPASVSSLLQGRP